MMASKKTKKSPLKHSNGASPGASKLISIRIPEKTIADLQHRAGKGGKGYQRLIKTYIAHGFAGGPASTRSAPPPIAPQPPPRSRGTPSLPDVMREDIDTLGKIFKPH